MKEVSKGVYFIEDRLATKNYTPGLTVYGENLLQKNDNEYRFWDPNRSKLSAAILKGLNEVPIHCGSKVLYLGAATGTTASHVSDVIGSQGIVYCVESSPTPMMRLLQVCNQRDNMIPIFEDANHPERYMAFLEKVDVVDVAQKNQSDLLLKNSDLYLKKDGSAILALKAKSIDSAASMNTVVSKELKKLKKFFKIKVAVDLEPFEKDHTFIVAVKK